jgi:hypothetical protein
VGPLEKYYDDIRLLELRKVWGKRGVVGGEQL